MDVCCLNRPFDDPRQDRIRFEAEAVLTILADCENDHVRLVLSEVVQWEIEAITESERRDKVMPFLKISSEFVTVNLGIIERGKELERAGFSGYDALHIACAEHSGADVFLTVDDGILRRAAKEKGTIKVKVMNPVNWLVERGWREDAENDVEPN